MHLLEGLQKCFLHDILRVLAVLCDLLSDTQKPPIVTAHQLLEGGHVPSGTCLYQGQVRIETLLSHGLNTFFEDGRIHKHLCRSRSASFMGRTCSPSRAPCESKWADWA